MSTIDNYIKSLTEIADNMDQVVRTIVLKNEGQLLKTVKLRLFQKSLDANLKSLGKYSSFTKARKKAKGQISNRVTLRDTGAWYRSMFIDFKNSEIIVDATDIKTGPLTDIYGDAILGLADFEKEHFVDSILDPEIDKIINNLDGFDIEI